MTKQEFVEKQKLEIIESDAHYKAIKSFKGLNGQSVLGLFPEELGKIYYIFNKVDNQIYKYLPDTKYKTYPSEKMSNWKNSKYQIPLEEFEKVDFTKINHHKKEMDFDKAFGKKIEPSDFPETPKPQLDNKIIEVEKRKNYFVDSRIQRIDVCMNKLDEIVKELKILKKEIE